VRLCRSLTRQFFARVGAILLVLTCCAAANAVQLDNQFTQQAIGTEIRYLMDADDSLTIHSLLSQAQPWEQNDSHIFNKGYNNQSWWLNFGISNQSDLEQWILELGYPVLDNIDLYLVQNGSILHEYHLGDKLPFVERPIQHRYFIVPITVTAGSESEVYIRLRSTSSVQLPLTIWDEKSFNQYDIQRNVTQGAYYGALAIIGIYNFLLFLVLRDRSYIYYVGYVIGMWLFSASLEGWAFQYIWPDATQWNDRAITVFLAGTVVLGLLFTSRFLGIYQMPKPMPLIQNGCTVATLLAFLVAIFAPYNISIRVVISVSVLISLWGLTQGINAWCRGNTSARYYTLAWILLIFGGVVLALSKFEILPRNIITSYALQLGTVLETVLLSFALAERINHEKGMRAAAQQAALNTQIKAKLELENKVAERTRELEAANRRLTEISDTDQLTGLQNRRALDKYLAAELGRSTRREHCICVILVDVDHFKSVNDTYGHLAGDDCLKEIAARIDKNIHRPTDFAARYGGEEFCIVLTETDEEGAEIVAQRIRSSVQSTAINTREGVINLTLSAGAFVALPTADTEAEHFLSMADKALYQSKASGRNRVTLLTQQSKGLYLAG